MIKLSYPIVLTLSTENYISYQKEKYSLTERNSPTTTNIGQWGCHENLFGFSLLILGGQNRLTPPNLEPICSIQSDIK